MLYHLAPYLERFWGPFRLLRSHALLLAIGTMLAAFAVLFLLQVYLTRNHHALPPAEN